MFRGKVTDVFFDLDHTLWDFEKNSKLTFEKILIENNIEIDLDDFLKIYIPTNFSFWKLYREEKINKENLRYQRLKVTFDGLKHTISDDKINLLADEYIAHLSSFNHVFPGTFEILDYLKKAYKLHIITNGFQEVQDRKLKNSKIKGYFNEVINSEMAGVKKPNPKIFQLALRQAKTTAKNSIMIGDSLEADILGAMDVGLYALHFNAHQEPRHNHCNIIHNLQEIKSFL